MLFFLASPPPPPPPLSHTSSEASASFDAWTSGRPSCQKHLPKFSAIASIARPYWFFFFLYLHDPRRLPRNADMFDAVLHLPSFLPPPFLYIPASGGSQHLFSPLSSGVSSSLTGGYTGRRGGVGKKNNRYPQIRSGCGRMPYSLLHTSDNSSRSVKPPPLLCFILPSVFLAVNRYVLSLLFLPSSQLASASGSHSPPHPSVSSPALPPFFFASLLPVAFLKIRLSLHSPQHRAHRGGPELLADTSLTDAVEAKASRNTAPVKRMGGCLWWGMLEWIRPSSGLVIFACAIFVNHLIFIFIWFFVSFYVKCQVKYKLGEAWGYYI